MKIKMLRRKRLIIAFIIILTLGVTIAGLYRLATARVYDSIKGFFGLSDIPLAPGSFSAPVQFGDYSFNGLKLDYKIYQSTENVDNVLSYYKKLFEAKGAKTYTFDLGQFSILAASKPLEKGANEKDIEGLPYNTRVIIGLSSGKGSTVIAVSPSENFTLSNLLAIAPEDGMDAPGEDPSFLPRIPGSVRISSAKMTRGNSKTYFFIYEHSSPPDAIKDFYDSALTQKGWQKAIKQRQSSTGEIVIPESVNIYTKGNSTCHIQTEETGKNFRYKTSIMCIEGG